jgi:hypothetical protein
MNTFSVPDGVPLPSVKIDTCVDKPAESRQVRANTTAVFDASGEGAVEITVFSQGLQAVRTHIATATIPHRVKRIEIILMTGGSPRSQAIYLFFVDAKATYAIRPTSGPATPATIEAWNVSRETIAPAPLLRLPHTTSTRK